MINLCHPVDEIEQLFLSSALNAASIPFFIVGAGIGSLYPGVQVPWYNERTIRVPANYFDEAQVVVAEVRNTYVNTSENLSTRSKFRFLFDFFLGWVILAGSKKNSPDKTN